MIKPGPWSQSYIFFFGDDHSGRLSNLPVNAGDIRDMDLIPGSGRSPEGSHGNPLPCSCLENPHGLGAWGATVHRVAQSQTGLK